MPGMFAQTSPADHQVLRAALRGFLLKRRNAAAARIYGPHARMTSAFAAAAQTLINTSAALSRGVLLWRCVRERSLLLISTLQRHSTPLLCKDAINILMLKRILRSSVRNTAAQNTGF